MVIDPNVLISAVISPLGAPAQLIEAVRVGSLRLVVRPKLIDELSQVLARDRFRRWLTLDDAERCCRDLTALADHEADPEPPYPPATRDPSDDYLVALALAAGVDALISGDDDFADTTSVTVHKPRPAVEALQQL